MAEGLPRYVVTEEAAGLAHRHPVSIRRSLEAGDLHGFQRVKGGRWLIQVDCLQAWIENVPCPHANVTELPSRQRAK